MAVATFQTNLVKRGTVWYFRKKIPADLQGHYKNPSGEIRESLKTSDKREAVQKAAARAAELEAEFARVRKALVSPPLEELDRQQIQQLSEAFLAHMLEEDEELRMDGILMDQYQRADSLRRANETIEWTRAGVADQLGHYDISSIAEEASDFAASHGFHIAPDSPAFRELCVAFLKAFSRAVEMSHRRSQGHPVDTPFVEPIKPPPARFEEGNEATLPMLLDYWQFRKKPAPGTLKKYSGVVAEFVDYYGSERIGGMTRAVFREFVNDRLNRGLKASTVADKVACLKALFGIYKRDEKIDVNPLDGVVVDLPKNQPKARVDFSPDDLRAIFSSPIYSTGARPRKLGGEAAYWLPVIALYAGMRLEEIGQLLVSDVKEERGIWYFDVNNEGEKRTKTASSVRRVPIHPALIDSGLLRYVDEQRKQGNKLFPQLKRNQSGKATATFSTGFGEYLRSVVQIADPRKTFHSFRHGWKTAARSAKVSTEVSDAITGHARKGDGAGYGDLPVALLAEEMARLVFPITVPAWDSL